VGRTGNALQRQIRNFRKQYIATILSRSPITESHAPTIVLQHPILLSLLLLDIRSSVYITLPMFLYGIQNDKCIIKLFYSYHFSKISFLAKKATAECMQCFYFAM
jgi:hypothetical protein